LLNDCQISDNQGVKAPAANRPAARSAEPRTNGSGEALYHAQTEIRNLQGTIQALRDELETMRNSKEAAVQAAVAAGANEARQLHAAVAALREELEKKIFQHATELEQQRHAANDELRLLRETIAALRDKLEDKQGA